jgi:nucleotide-binding universal stress UspA family protein
MTFVSDILVPLDGSPEALESLGVATWLASRLAARVHILNAGEPPPGADALARLGVPETYRAFVELHQVRGEAAASIVAATQRYQAGLIVMTARGQSVPAPAEFGPIVGHVTREVIEQSGSPVLVLPPYYREALPWRSVLVPLSGEPATDESLTVALHLAQALDLRVAIAHVVEAVPPGGGTGRYADEAHHEFAQTLNQLVARACPTCTEEERSRIEAFHLAHGNVAEELEELITRDRASVLVVGWRGDFMVGHAQVLKALVQRIYCPVLLVKPVPPRQPFRLKVGEAFE